MPPDDSGTDGPLVRPWRGPSGLSKYGQLAAPEESRESLAPKIGKLSNAKAKAVLTALSARIKQTDQPGFDPKRIWVEDKGVQLLDALAKKVGLQADFKGNPKAPQFDDY